MRPFRHDLGQTTSTAHPARAGDLVALALVMASSLPSSGCLASSGGSAPDAAHEDASLAGGGAAPDDGAGGASAFGGSAAGPSVGSEDASTGAGGAGARPLEVLVAFDDAGALVLVRSSNGAVVGRRELGPGSATDVVVDQRHGRIIVVLEQEEEMARIVEVPFDVDGLGSFRQLGQITGRARIALVDAGVVIAADADGPRVRLLRDDGVASPGKALTAPRSWWSDPTLARVHGLEVPSGAEAQRFTLGVAPGGGVVIEERRPLGVTPGDARLVALEGEEWLVLWNEAGGTVDLQRLAGAGGLDGAAARVAGGVGRLDGAIAWPEGQRTVALTTAEPAALLVVPLDAGDGSEVTRHALPAAPPSGSPYGRRDLVVAAGALFVATRAGVTRVSPPGEVESTAFDGETLRGPLGRLAD